jgi:hypothetical protein
MGHRARRHGGRLLPRPHQGLPGLGRRIEAEQILRSPEVAPAITAVCVRLSERAAQVAGNQVLVGLGLEPIDFEAGR